VTISILAIHQGHELYGSDRVFLQTLEAVHRRHPTSRLTIVLPRDGPLADEIRRRYGKVRIDDQLAVLRRCELQRMGLRWLARLARGVRRAHRQMAAHDVVLINTVTIADYLIASRFSSTPAVVHVHELVTGLERPFYGLLLGFSSAAFMVISRAALHSFPGLLRRRTRVIHNGVAGVAAGTPESWDLSLGQSPVRLLVIGRISERKGQQLLIEALARLPAPLQSRWQLRIVGGVYGDDDRPRQALEAQIRRTGLQAQIELLEFTPVPSPHYAWAQLVIVPSARPEPFGLTAVEAMAHGRAVVAAAHGGLTEIVTDRETGRLFRPNDANALASAIGEYLQAPVTLREHGEAARQRQLTYFSQARYQQEAGEFLDELLPASLWRPGHSGGTEAAPPADVDDPAVRR
jgi:glycosyltransferase involved in cell wall biosynthesis